MKNFFKHAGIALGCAALFYAVQIAASTAFMLGETAGFSLQLIFSGGTAAGMFQETQLFGDAMMQIYFDFSGLMMLLIDLTLLALGMALLYAERPDGPLAAARIVKPRGMAMLWAPAALGILVFYAVGSGLMLIPEDMPLMQQYIEASSAIDVGKWPWLSFVVTVIGAPVVEELFFRGLIYRHLKRAMPSRLVWLALILQAVIFGMAHGQLLWMAYAFVLGLVLGLVYDYFDSLLPCMLLHLCFNASNYIPFLAEPDATGMLILMLGSLLLSAVVMLGLVLYRRARPEQFAARTN